MEKKSSNNRKLKNSIYNGFSFLIKSVYSQWRNLLTITLIFLIMVFVLACLTFGFDKIGDNINFKFPDEEHSDKINFFESFWWVYITISTIGYGDIYPLTFWMRIWAIFISLIGISFIALYTAVIVNGFTQEFQKRRKKISKIELYEEYLKKIETLENRVSKLKTQNKELKKELDTFKTKN